MNFYSHFGKRVLDVMISGISLLLLWPLIVFVAGAVWIFSGRPVIFTQERVGFQGRRFAILKFRSMIVDAEKNTGPILTKENDPRMTKIGAVLRKTRLDELPQLWNVFVGNMSLIGPRPVRQYFVDRHKEYSGYRLTVKPGLTGLAQVCGCYALTPREKARFDYLYIKNLAFGLDFKILAMTIPILLRGAGSCIPASKKLKLAQKGLLGNMENLKLEGIHAGK